MNDSVKYKKLQDLVAEIQHRMNDLQAGKLSREELEHLTETGKEVYERLVVLRFKAYSEENKGVAESKDQVAEALPVFTMKLEDQVPVNQVSLIDVIEEVTKIETPEPVVVKAPAPTPSVKATTPTPAVKPVVTPVTAPPVLATPVAATPPVNSPKEALHEKLTRTVGTKETLADKLENNPIPDLKKAISLNQRFQFSKELFKGNNQDYEMSIDKLNTASREDALNHLHSLKAKYTWNDESAVAQDFIGLVERRHA